MKNSDEYKIIIIDSLGTNAKEPKTGVKNSKLFKNFKIALQFN